MGHFIGNEERLPYDYDELIATIAPRPVFVSAAELDWRVDHEQLRACINRAKGAYKLLGAEDALSFEMPYDYLSFWPDRQQRTIAWFDQVLK